MDSSIKFKKITYKDLLKSTKEQKMVLMGFDNISMSGLSIHHIMTSQGIIYDIDENKMSALVDNDSNYCIVCRQEDIPSSIRGNFMGKPVQYKIIGMDCIVKADMKKVK